MYLLPSPKLCFSKKSPLETLDWDGPGLDLYGPSLGGPDLGRGCLDNIEYRLVLYFCHVIIHKKPRIIIIEMP